jgi:hypothetical protein
MLGVPLRYLLKHPIVGIADLAANPWQVCSTIRDDYVAIREQRAPACHYEPDEGWEARLHHSIGASWPCEATAEFRALWPRILKSIEEKGIRPGPESYQGWNDGDGGLVRAIWCLVRHLKPRIVIETGVAHGVTTRSILEGMERNGDGHLWSIDLPPIERHLRHHIGLAVDRGQFAKSWSLVKGSSRMRLPKLLADLGQIDLFVHDSLHTERNVRFELDLAWAMLRPGGALVIDDVDANWGFHSFTQTFSNQQSMICVAEPVRPDLRRFNKKGLFGIILKQPLSNRLP